MSGGCEFFAERLRRLRKARGYTQTLFGERLGISRHAIAQWEAFRAAPDRNRIPDLARLLGVSTDYLLTGRENAHIAALHHAIRAGASQQQLMAMIGEIRT
jgi:transcriptional regulator with XRE-family HTH domain